jgi:tRNA A37 threonylcarbamoyladenosine dehydratase
LIESFRRLEGSSNRFYQHDSQYARDYEAAIADIQLFGTAKQIELAQILITDHLSKGSASCDELLEELRRDLRKELDLESVPRKRMYVRIVPKE